MNDGGCGTTWYYPCQNWGVVLWYCLSIGVRCDEFVTSINYVPSKWDTCIHVCTSINVHVFQLRSNNCKLVCLRIKSYILKLMALYLMYVYIYFGSFYYFLQVHQGHLRHWPIYNLLTEQTSYHTCIYTPVKPFFDSVCLIHILFVSYYADYCALMPHLYIILIINFIHFFAMVTNIFIVAIIFINIMWLV